MTPRSERSLDWKIRAPRWLLVSLIAALGLLSGFAWGRYSDLDAANEDRLLKAYADAPTKYQARLSERIAVLEAQVSALGRSLDALGADNRKLTGAVVDLTYELREIRTELKGRVAR